MSDIQVLIQELDDKLAATDDPIVMANIYYEAGLLFEQNEDIDEACFFITQAFIFASHYGEETITKTAREFLLAHDRI